MSSAERKPHSRANSELLVEVRRGLIEMTHMPEAFSAFLELERRTRELEEQLSTTQADLEDVGKAAVREARRCNEFRKRYEEKEREWSVEHDRANGLQEQFEAMRAAYEQEANWRTENLDEIATLKDCHDAAEEQLEAVQRERDQLLAARHRLTLAYDELKRDSNPASRAEV